MVPYTVLAVLVADASIVQISQVYSQYSVQGYPLQVCTRLLVLDFLIDRLKLDEK